MNKRIGVALALAGLLIISLFIAVIIGYKVAPNNNPPDLLGEDKGTP
jgi:hypothetical protein